MNSLINWKKSLPFFSDHDNNPFLSLQKEMDKAMDRFYEFFEKSPSYPADMQKLILNPSIDIVEDDKNFKVVAEMPGMSEEDIKVEISDRVLFIQGKKELSRKDEGKDYISREIGYGTYERALSLPDYVEADKAKASFKKGMLWVNFPKKENAKKQRLELKVEKATDEKR